MYLKICESQPFFVSGVRAGPPGPGRVLIILRPLFLPLRPVFILLVSGVLGNFIKNVLSYFFSLVLTTSILGILYLLLLLFRYAIISLKLHRFFELLLQNRIFFYWMVRQIPKKQVGGARSTNRGEKQHSIIEELIREREGKRL